MQTQTNEGWYFLLNSTKYHYFVESVSLCHKYSAPGATGLRPYVGFYTKNECTPCRRLANKRNAA